jgi:guanidinoacetate N-methyltransferase
MGGGGEDARPAADAQPRYSDPVGWRSKPVGLDPNGGLLIGSEQVMQYWERPLMRQLAAFATRRGGRVLEVGFGLGISASYVMEAGCEEYCVVEAHPVIAERARQWGKAQPVPVRVIEDFWQNAVGTIGRFDGVLFDTFPMNAEERSRNHFPFLGQAPRLLNEGAYLTYYSDETRDFRPEHLRLILENYSCVELAVVDGLKVPAECRYWSSDHMGLPCLSQPREPAPSKVRAALG